MKGPKRARWDRNGHCEKGLKKEGLEEGTEKGTRAEKRHCRGARAEGAQTGRGDDNDDPPPFRILILDNQQQMTINGLIFGPRSAHNQWSRDDKKREECTLDPAGRLGQFFETAARSARTPTGSLARF